MAVGALRLRSDERGLARSFDRRSPQAGASSFDAPVSQSTSTPAASVASGHSTTVAYLAGAVVVLGLIVLGVLIWHIYKWRSMRNWDVSTSAERTAHRINFDSDESEKPVLSPPLSPPGVGWTPQYISFNDIQAAQTASLEPSRNYSRPDPPSNQRTPPPGYPLQKNHPESPSFAPSISMPQHPPPAKAKPKKTNNGPIPPELNLNRVSHPYAVATPMPSPRSSSFVHEQLPNRRNSRHSIVSRINDRPLPRLMTVSDTFVPSLDDELGIKLAETVRLLEEYDDEWCLCQCLGPAGRNSRTGVVPRFCLQELDDHSVQ